MYYSWEKIIKNCQYFVCIRVHSLYIILCGSTFGFNYISNSVWIGLHQHRTSGFHHFIPPFVQKSSNCEKTSSSQPIVGQFTDLLQIWSLSTDSIAIPGHWSYFFFFKSFPASAGCVIWMFSVLSIISVFWQNATFCTKISLYLS